MTSPCKCGHGAEEHLNGCLSCSCPRFRIVDVEDEPIVRYAQAVLEAEPYDPNDD